MKLRKLRISALQLSCIAAQLAVLPAHAAFVSEHMPPPGLYRVNDLNGEINHAMPGGMDTHVRNHVAGANGDQTRTDRVGATEITMHSAGSGPSTMCVPPVTARTPAMLPAPAGCPPALGVAGPTEVVAKQHCSFGDLVVTTRKVDATTWRYDISYTANESQVGAAPTGANPLRGMFEAMAASGTPEERAAAKESLKHMPEMEAQAAAVNAQRAALAPQLAKARKEAAASGVTFPTGRPIMEHKTSYTITKIGATCSR